MKHYTLHRNLEAAFFKTGSVGTSGSINQITFAGEDILGLLRRWWKSAYVREVSIPNDASVSELSLSPEIWLADKVKMGPARELNSDVLTELINEGANVGVNNDVALRWAVRAGYLDITRVLLDNGANATTTYNEALDAAISKGHVEIFELLVERGVDIHFQEGYPLRLACSHGNIQIVRILFSLGADIDVCGGAPLTTAILSEKYEVVKFLLENGVDIHSVFEKAMELAKHRNYYMIMELLEQYASKKFKYKELI